MIDNAVATRSSTRVLGRRKSTRRTTVGRIRWLIAPFGAAIVIAGVVGGATFGHSIVQRIMTEGGVVAPIASAAAPAATAPQPDTVSRRITAADYTQIRGDTSVIAGRGDTSLSAPFLPTTTIAHSPPPAHSVVDSRQPGTASSGIGDVGPAGPSERRGAREHARAATVDSPWGSVLRCRWNTPDGSVPGVDFGRRDR